MFGDLFGKMEESQAAMKKQLASLTIEGEAGGVKVTANGNREITGIDLPKDILASGDKEQIEDLLIVAINRTLKLAADKEAEEGQNLLQRMTPPGLGDLGNLFK